MSKRDSEWVEIARRGRNHAILVITQVAEAFRRGLVQEKMQWGFTPSSYRQIDGARWMRRRDVEGFHDAVARSEKRQSGYLVKKAKEYEWVITQVKKWGERRSVDDVAGMSASELLELFAEYCEQWIQTYGYVYSYIFINDYLARELGDIIATKQTDPRKQMNDLFTLVTPKKKSDMRLEKEEIVALARAVHGKQLTIGDAEWKKRIQRHLQRFAHLHRYVYYGASYTARDIRTRVQAMLMPGRLRQTQKELQISEPDATAVQRLIRRYGFSPRERNLIDAAHSWTYVPNFWDETFIYHVHILQPMFQEIARRIGVTENELYEMTSQEILQFLKHKRKTSAAQRKKFRDRYEDSAVLFEKGHVRLLEGAALKRYRRQEMKYQKEERKVDVTEFKGQPASPGKAEGRVSLVLSVTAVGKVRKGDILVTPATTPMHVPAMERASAVVTDEGGLLSHAAIVSRELGIPCVVDTKIGTQVLKDGDTIVVDADTGVVRKK